MSIVISVIIGLLCLTFLVAFHEAGHFIAAKLCGVKVESFSIGMGPILLHKNYRNTDYRISLFPIGGYCGMKGEQDFQKAIELNLKEINAEPDSFYGIHPLKRAFIAFAGPFANFIFAVISFTIIAIIGYTYYSASAKVLMADSVYEGMTSVAHNAGMQDGDIITAINGEAVLDFSDIVTIVSTHPDEIITVDVERDGEKLSFSMKTALNKETGGGVIGVVSNPDTIEERQSKRYSFFPAILHGVKETTKMCRATVVGIITLFKGVKVSSAVSGPARITTMLGDTVKASFKASLHAGIVNTLEFMALISVSLFMMNLLPIPVLDGGLILAAIVEFVLRRKLSPLLLYRIQIIGIVFIACLFLIAIYGDIHYFTSSFRR